MLSFGERRKVALLYQCVHSFDSAGAIMLSAFPPPRIDPMKLLVCLSVLLAPNGGIRNAGEVRRLANLMAKFSKKLVSKAIYIQILKCTETELLGQFMQTGGWSLVHMWLVDGIGSKNWPLIQELMELLLCCPVDVERLKINSTPRLVKSLSTDSANESVKVLASKLVEQWLSIVKAPKQVIPMIPINQSELPAITTGLDAGKQMNAEMANNNASTIGAAGKHGAEMVNGMGNEQHYQHNGYGSHDTATGDSAEIEDQTETSIVDGGKQTFQGAGEHQSTATTAAVQPKKTSLVLKITTKNGKQVVAKVIKSGRKSQRSGEHAANEHETERDDDEEEDEDEEDQEEVVVNIESSKVSDETTTVAVVQKADQQEDVTDAKKLDVQNGIEGSKERNSSSSKERDRHHHSRDDSIGGGGGSNDSGSETSSIANTSASNDSKVAKSTSATIPSKKASISIEVRNPENRPKTVKTYNSQFRSHGLIEEAPPPPSRKGLKKPSSSTSSSSPSTASGSSSSGSTSIGSTAIGTMKRSSPVSSGRDAVMAGAPVEKKAREDPLERPGSIKLIPPKRQHALVESDMFMDALSATLRKDVKKRKRRTSGSESTANAAVTTAITGSKPGESTTPNGSKPSGSDAKANNNAPASPTAATAEGDTSETVTPATATPTSPKVPAIAPMSFYRDTLAEQEEEENGTTDSTAAGEDGEKKDQTEKESSNGGSATERKNENEDEPAANDEEDEEPIVKKPKRVKCELNNDDEEEKDKDSVGEEKKEGVKKEVGEGETPEDDKTELIDAVMSDVELKIAKEAQGVKKEDGTEKEEEALSADGKKPPGPGCGPDGPPGVLVIHRRKGPKKQLRWRAAEELEEVRYFELDVTERCNVTKSFTDMKQMERVDERQKFMLSRKIGSEDIMVERTAWRPLLLVDNVPPSPDGNQSLERNVQRQRERGCLQALYFNKHMIPDSPVEPDPADTYQTADPVHIPLEDVTGNPDSVNDFTSVPWPDPRSTPPHESAAFNSPFFPSDLPPGAGFGAGGFPPPFAPGAAATIGPGPWNLGPPGVAAAAGGPRQGVLPPGMFPLNQPPPGLGQPAGGSPNMLNLPLSMSPNVPPPGMFPGATNFNAPPPELALLAAAGGGGGPDMGGRRGVGPGGPDFRNGPPPPHHQQWSTGGGGAGNNRPFGGNNPSRGGFGNRGGGGNWNNNRNNGNNNNNGNRNGNDRSRMGDDGRGNFRGHWMQGGNRGHNNNRGAGGRKW
uniref:TFIIS N-terminal domain-containing protein n=1 Tax=Anopheles epiroticus TaxID=199890 RepID=A0A182P5H8_9DIPT